MQNVRPDLIDFVVEVAKNEQNFRINYKNKELDIITKSSNKEYSLNLLGLFFAFIVMLTGMYFSTLMINKGNDLVGTIFAGVTLVMGVSVFINPFKKK